MFLDKNGLEVNVGDKLISDANVDVLVVSQFYVEEIGEDCLFVQQIQNPLSFSYLTKDNLALQFTKI